MKQRGGSDWRAAAHAAADLPPAVPRAPLWLDGHAVGSIEPALAARLVDAGLPLAASDDGLGWRIAGPADASLATIAHWLHEQGLSARWRDERLAVTSANGSALAAVERAVVRVLGITTRAVHLVGFAPDGRIWVQQRAFDKAVDPGLWDTLMGGQVAAGESVEATLARETLEEAGLALADLRGLERSAPIVMRRPVREGYLVERIEVFRATLDRGVVPTNRDGEVERFECLADAALLDRLAGGEFTLEATLILGAELEHRGVLHGRRQTERPRSR